MNNMASIQVYVQSFVYIILNPVRGLDDQLHSCHSETPYPMITVQKLCAVLASHIVNLSEGVQS